MMNDRAISALRKALFDDQFIFTRIVLSLSELTWAFLLMWPGRSFDRPTYSAMAHIMSEEAWAFVFLVTGIIQITIVLREDYYCPVARYFAAWNAALWSTVVVGMLLSVSPPPAAISGEIVLAMASFWIWLRPFLIIRGLEYARRQR